MQTAVYVIAPLLLALVLVASALGKLKAPDRARAALSALGVPQSLDRAWIARAHPWAEIALAVLLVVVPGPLGVVVSAAALLLMLVYLVLVIRAVSSPVDVDCACFGSLGDDRITRATVWRNVWLTAVASTASWSSLEGRSVISRLGDLSGAEWWWMLAVVAAGMTVALVLGTGRAAEPEQEVVEQVDLEAEGDYLRSRTPAVPVVLGDGSRTDVRALSAQRAQLLVFVSEGCAPCGPVIASVPQWREELPQLDVRFVVQVGPEASKLTSDEEPRTLHDIDGFLKESFGTRRTPSAMLLGADGLLAGGPVIGGEAVPAFVAEIREQLGA